MEAYKMTQEHLYEKFTLRQLIFLHSRIWKRKRIECRLQAVEVAKVLLGEK